MSSADCGDDQICIDNVCESREVPDGGETDALMCEADETLCGLRCCAAGELCSDTMGCVTDCGSETRCGDLCCGTGELCQEGACIPDCASDEQLCGAAGEQVCCTSDQACLSNMCADLGVECEFTEDCELDEICLLTLGRCAPRDAVEVCEFVPEPGPFDPTIACQWRPGAGDPLPTFDDVVMTPSVANLTDDNEDGVTDTNDIPDIVFVSFDRQANGCCTTNGRVRIVSGLCNEDGTMNTIHTFESVAIDNSSGIALGNLNPDSMPGEHPPEIVATSRVGTIAWHRTADDGTAWEVMWQNTTYAAADHTRGGAQPSIVDLDGDGAPEVLVGNVVLNGQTGELVWDGRVTVGTSAGIGNNAFLGPVSTAADVDLDGDMEVFAGNTLYDGADGSEVWTFTYTSSNSTCQGSLPCDGYNAIGNFDGDPEAELVIIREGEVFIIEHTGELLEKIVLPVDDCTRNESGPPTIADFDGDGRAEIGTASADFYVVADLDCIADPLPAECDSRGILWKAANQDCSSRATGSSVFDFEGDGAAEVVYADETTFYVFDGRTGAVLYRDDSHSSNTRMEMPIVVDVDNDGKSEVIVPEPNTSNVNLGGIEVWEDPMNNWVRTRRIWNQHSYHVTNITEDGQVPRYEEPNWSNERLNNFRQNVQPGGLFDAPDLQIESIVLASCNASTDTAEIEVTVTNAGALGVAPGVPVVAYATQAGGTEELIGVERTTRFLLPGQSETITFTWSPAGGFSAATFTVRAIVDDDGMGGSEYNECIEDNNESTSMALMTCMLG